MSDSTDPVERALELFVFAPIGALLYLRDIAPGFVRMLAARGRAEIDRHHERVQEHVTTVRSTGQVALAFGIPTVREHVQRRVDALRGREPAPASDAADGPAAPAPPSPATAAPAAPPAAPADAPPRPTAWAPLPARPTVVDAPSREELPIPGYDALSASQVVERLAGLLPRELDAVHAYEIAHRQRRTILGKIEQLAG